MLNETLAGQLQQQFNHERANEAFYQAAADALETAYWPGTARWMRNQAADEASHARRLAAFLIAQGIRPEYASLPAPELADPGNPASSMQQALLVERATTQAIDRLFYLAEAQESPAAQELLHWFIREQVEEEQAITDQLQAMQRADCSAAQLILDREKLK